MEHSNSMAREDVLYEFATELSHTPEVLESYLQVFPQYAPDLIDLSFEITLSESDDPLTEEDQDLIDQLWTKHLEAHT